MADPKNEKIIKGVSCDVKNCTYHTKENECSAGSIYVVPRDSFSDKEADCGTFEPKDFYSSTSNY